LPFASPSLVLQDHDYYASFLQISQLHISWVLSPYLIQFSSCLGQGQSYCWYNPTSAALSDESDPKTLTDAGDDKGVAKGKDHITIRNDVYKMTGVGHLESSCETVTPAVLPLNAVLFLYWLYLQ